MWEPNQQGWDANWKLSWNIHLSCVFVHVLAPQFHVYLALINQIWPKFCSKELGDRLFRALSQSIKGGGIVGWEHFSFLPKKIIQFAQTRICLCKEIVSDRKCQKLTPEEGGKKIDFSPIYRSTFCLIGSEKDGEAICHKQKNILSFTHSLPPPFFLCRSDNLWLNEEERMGQAKPDQTCQLSREAYTYVDICTAIISKVFDSIATTVSRSQLVRRRPNKINL